MSCFPSSGQKAQTRFSRYMAFFENLTATFLSGTQEKHFRDSKNKM